MAGSGGLLDLGESRLIVLGTARKTPSRPITRPLLLVPGGGVVVGSGKSVTPDGNRLAVGRPGRPDANRGGINPKHPVLAAGHRPQLVTNERLKQASGVRDDLRC